jgi:hypothetical protein
MMSSLYKVSLYGFAAVFVASMAIHTSACTTSPGAPVDGGSSDASTADANTADATRADAADSTTDANSTSAFQVKCEQLFAAAIRMADRCSERAGRELSGRAYRRADKLNYVSACVAQAGAPGVDITTLDACLNEAETTTLCVDLLELEAPFPEAFQFEGVSSLAACRAKPGMLAKGAACAYPSQCASKQCSTYTMPTPGVPYCGVCFGDASPEVAPAAENAFCTPFMKCISGAQCIQNRCQLSVVEGGFCDPGTCAEGLACVRGAGLGTPSTCQRRRALGETCGPTCCKSGLTCAQGTCQAYPIIAEGGDCSFNLSPSVLCDAETSCVSSGPSGQRTCVRVDKLYAGPGQNCATGGISGNCARTLHCVHDRCEVAGANRCSAPFPADAGSSDASPD